MCCPLQCTQIRGLRTTRVDSTTLQASPPKGRCMSRTVRPCNQALLKVGACRPIAFIAYSIAQRHTPARLCTHSSRRRLPHLLAVWLPAPEPGVATTLSPITLPAAATRRPAPCEDCAKRRSYKELLSCAVAQLPKEPCAVLAPRALPRRSK